MPDALNEKLRRFVEETPGAVMAAGPDFKILLCSTGLTELTGYSAGELSDMPASQLLKNAEKAMQKAGENGFAFNIKTSINKKDGQSVPGVLQVSSPQKDFPEAYVILVQEHEKTTQDKSEAEILKDFLRIVRSIGSSAGRTSDRQKFLEQACENLVRMGGYKSAWIALTGPEDGKVFMTAEHGFGVLPIEEDLKRGEFCYCMKMAVNQSPVLIIEDPLGECGGCPIATIFGKTSAMTQRIGFAGRIYGVINVHAHPDIASDRKEQDRFSEIVLSISSALHSLELEDQRAEAERETIKARKMKSDFLSLISHRMRTPLTPVNEGVSILMENLAGELNPEQRNIMSTVSRNAANLTKIVEKVVKLEKLQNGMEELNIRAEDAGEILEKVKENSMKDAMLKDISIVIRAPESPVRVEMDGSKISEALKLLVSNALRHTDRGEITLAVSQNNGKAVFSVSDTGRGIPKEKLPVIFERFETAEQDGTTGGGAGLGLSICREIVALHGGRISVESETGAGSTFRFEIPLKNTSAGKGENAY